MIRKFLLSVIVTFFIVSSTYAAPPVVRLAPLTISIAQNTTTVTTNATALPATALVGRESIAIRLNSTTDTVYLGNSNVTASTGFPLDSSVPAITLDLDDSVIVYGIVSSGTADIRTVEIK